MESIWTEERQEAAVETAKLWVGTPHRNRIAIPGRGIDCINLIREILVGSGICEKFKLPYYHPGQGMGLKFNVMEWVSDQVFFCEKVEEPAFGDLLIFSVGHQTNHVGFCLGHVMVHASMKGTVIESMEENLNDLQAIMRITKPGFKSKPERLNIRQFREEAAKHGKR